jgi:hypothetical protein
MADEVEYEGLPPNAGLGVWFLELCIRVISSIFQVSMMAGALVGIFSSDHRRLSRGSYEINIVNLLGWDY